MLSKTHICANLTKLFSLITSFDIQIWDIVYNTYLVMPFTDDQIRGAVINLFARYDRDNSGYIDGKEIHAVCNDLGS